MKKNKFIYRPFYLVVICLMVNIKSFSQSLGFNCDSIRFGINNPINELPIYYFKIFNSSSFWEQNYENGLNRTLYLIGDYTDNEQPSVSLLTELNCQFSESEAPNYIKYKEKFDTNFVYNEDEKVSLNDYKIIEYLVLKDRYSTRINKNTFDKSTIFSFKKLNINDFKFNRLFLVDASVFYKKIYQEVISKQVLNIEKIEIEEPFDSLPGYLSEFRNLKNLKLKVLQADGLGVVRLSSNYSTIFLNKLLSNLSNELRSVYIDKIGGNLFIPERSIKRFKKLEVLHTNLENKESVPIVNIPVSLLLNQNFKFLYATIDYNSENNENEGDNFYYKDYCNLCYERTCQRLDYTNKLDTIIFRDLEQKIYATGKVNDDNLAEGKWLFYHKNGTIAEERYYKQGIEVGEWLMYDEKGNRVGHYEFKKDTTICTYYKSTGGLGYQYILFNNYTDGIYKRWNDVGILITEKRYKSSRYK